MAIWLNGRANGPGPVSRRLNERHLVKFLDNISDQDIVELNIPTGIPLVYELDQTLKPLKNYYLGDPEAAKKAADAVAKQGSRA